jgi:hypothetical protein
VENFPLNQLLAVDNKTKGNSVDKTGIHHSNNATENIDQACETIFKLSTGTLALSITFRDGIVSSDTSHHWLLACAWIALAIVPTSYVFIKLVDAGRDMFLSSFCRNDNEDERSEITSYKKLPAKLKLHIIYQSLLKLALINGFLVGVICFLAFAIVNIKN